MKKIRIDIFSANIKKFSHNSNESQGEGGMFDRREFAAFPMAEVKNYGEFFLFAIFGYFFQKSNPTPGRCPGDIGTKF